MKRTSAVRVQRLVQGQARRRGSSDGTPSWPVDGGPAAPFRHFTRDAAPSRGAGTRRVAAAASGRGTVSRVNPLVGTEHPRLRMAGEPDVRVVLLRGGRREEEELRVLSRQRL